MSKTYTYKELIDSHILIALGDRLDHKLSQYYAALVAVLEQLFEAKLLTPKEYRLLKPAGETPDYDYWPLWVLFERTVYLIQRPYLTEGWIMGGPSVTLFEMRNSNSLALKTLDTLRDAVSQEESMKEKYRELLYELFATIYGKTELTFTSGDLLKMGFDDAKEPNWNDYVDSGLFT